MERDQLLQVLSLSAFSGSRPTLGSTRWGSVVGTKLGTVETTLDDMPR